MCPCDRNRVPRSLLTWILSPCPEQASSRFLLYHRRCLRNRREKWKGLFRLFRQVQLWGRISSLYLCSLCPAEVCTKRLKARLPLLRGRSLCCCDSWKKTGRHCPAVPLPRTDYRGRDYKLLLILFRCSSRTRIRVLR